MPSTNAPKIAMALNDQVAPLAPDERLAILRETVPGRIVFTTSFGLEDQAITQMIANAGLDIKFATLDTGRLFPETYDLWAETETRFGVKIQPYYPSTNTVETLIARQGINGFYGSVDARKACCGARKVEPLARALAGAQAWITGLRADQSEQRGETDFVTFDAARDLIKFNPIFDWTRDDTAAYVARETIPVSPLHARGFLSIGCAPCTRAVTPGETERAGRWWWEQDNAKECGLHVAPDGRLVRASAGAPA